MSRCCASGVPWAPLLAARPQHPHRLLQAEVPEPAPAPSAPPPAACAARSVSPRGARRAGVARSQRSHLGLARAPPLLVLACLFVSTAKRSSRPCSLSYSLVRAAAALRSSRLDAAGPRAVGQAQAEQRGRGRGGPAGRVAAGQRLRGTRAVGMEVTSSAEGHLRTPVVAGGAYVVLRVERSFRAGRAPAAEAAEESPFRRRVGQAPGGRSYQSRPHACVTHRTTPLHHRHR